MIYKFETRITTEGNTALELSIENEYLRIASSDYEEDLKWNVHYFKSEDIDDMIIALTNLKNEISEWKRKK